MLKRMMAHRCCMNYLCDRLVSYYQRHGFLRTGMKALRKCAAAIRPRPDILFYADLSAWNPPPCAPSTVCVLRCLSNPDQLDADQRRELNRNRGEAIVAHEFDERFPRGAQLWLICMHDRPAGFVWSIRGITVKPHYFALSQSDAHLFDNEVFHEYRGRGVNVRLIDGVLRELKLLGIMRAHIETKTDNCAEIRSLLKTPFMPYAIARKVNMGERVIVSWGGRQRLLKAVGAAIEATQRLIDDQKRMPCSK